MITQHTIVKVRKNGQQKTCNLSCNIAQNELHSDVARFTTDIKPVLQQIRLLTTLKVGGKTRNIAIQLVCCPFFRTLTRLFSIIVRILLLLPFSLLSDYIIVFCRKQAGR